VHVSHAGYTSAPNPPLMMIRGADVPSATSLDRRPRPVCQKGRLGRRESGPPPAAERAPKEGRATTGQDQILVLIEPLKTSGDDFEVGALNSLARFTWT
jgi:hypothetical protein